MRSARRPQPVQECPTLRCRQAGIAHTRGGWLPRFFTGDDCQGRIDLGKVARFGMPLLSVSADGPSNLTTAGAKRAAALVYIYPTGSSWRMTRTSGFA